MIEEFIDHCWDELEAGRPLPVPPPDLLARSGPDEVTEFRERYARMQILAARPPSGSSAFAPAAEFTAEQDQFAGYRLMERIAEGAQGVVYRAEDRALGREVAIKVAKFTSGAGDDVLAERMRFEGRALSQIEHPNIVGIHDSDLTNSGVPYLVMDFVDGPTLAEFAKHHGPMSPAVVAKLVRVLARALHVIHEKGLVHRDLKPSNIRIRPLDPAAAIGEHEVAGVGRPVLLDFGLIWSTEVAAQGLTGQSEIAGTPQYMAPEQVDHDRRLELTRCTDVWALGVILYELLFGAPPFAGSNFLLLTQIRLAEPDGFRLRTRRTSADSADLVAVCRRCLEKSPRSRYRSAAELADDLDRYLDGRPTLVRPIGVVGGALRSVRRHRMVFGAIAAVMVALVITVVVSWRAARRSEANARLALGALTTINDRIVGDSGLVQRGLAGLQAELVRRVLPSLEEYARSEDASAGDELRGRALTSIALGQQHLGGSRQALAAAEQAEAIFAGLLAGATEDDGEVRYGHAMARARRAIILGQSEGRTSESLALLETALGELRSIDLDSFHDPMELSFRIALAELNLGNASRERDPNRAVAAYRAAIAHFRSFEAQSDDHRIWLVKALSNLALALPAIDADIESEAVHREAVDLGRAYFARVEADIARLEPTPGARVERHLDYREAFAVAETNLGEFLCALGRESEAEPILRDALQHYEALNVAAPSYIEFAWSVAMAQTNVARATLPRLSSPNLAAEARELCRAADDWYRRARAQRSDHAELAAYHAQNRFVAADIAIARGDVALVDAMVGDALMEFDAHLTADPVLRTLGSMVIGLADRQAPTRAALAWQHVFDRLDACPSPRERWVLLVMSRLLGRLVGASTSELVVARWGRVDELLAEYEARFGSDHDLGGLVRELAARGR